MPAERTAMRQVREVLRLKFVGGVPTREIARRMGVAASTVRAPISRFQAAGLSWPLPEELTDDAALNIGGELPTFRAGLLNDLLSRRRIRGMPAQAQRRAHFERARRPLGGKIELALGELADIISGAPLRRH